MTRIVCDLDLKYATNVDRYHGASLTNATFGVFG